MGKLFSRLTRIVVAGALLASLAAADGPQDNVPDNVRRIPKLGIEISDADRQVLEDTTLTINAFFGWDFNSCESLRNANTKIWNPIDFANPCPDSQVTSLHYHFPWLVKAYLKWAIFTAATKRPMRKAFDWAPFYEIAKKDLSYPEKLKEYGKLSRKILQAEEFEEFCAKHLKHLDEVAWEFFATNEAKDAVRQKVTALFPAHEIEPFTELFFRRIQQWRADQK